jgi:hypothetical protein
MRGWRAAHLAVGTTAALSWASGYIPGGALHMWLATLALPAVVWLSWVGRGFLLSVGRPTRRKQGNAVFARLSLGLLVLAALSGVWAGSVDGTLEHSRALRWHTVASDLLLPTLAAHVGLSIALRLARWRLRGAR